MLGLSTFGDNERPQLLLIIVSIFKLSVTDFTVQTRTSTTGTSGFENEVNTILCKVCLYNRCSAFQIINDPSSTAVAVKKGDLLLSRKSLHHQGCPERR